MCQLGRPSPIEPRRATPTPSESFSKPTLDRSIASPYPCPRMQPPQLDYNGRENLIAEYGDLHERHMNLLRLIEAQSVVTTFQKGARTFLQRPLEGR
jgi:hypothetical protein